MRTRAASAAQEIPVRAGGDADQPTETLARACPGMRGHDRRDDFWSTQTTNWYQMTLSYLGIVLRHWSVTTRTF